jgi:antitoxin PrlF
MTAIAHASTSKSIRKNRYSLGMKTIVSEKGQITIPKRLRDRLGIRPGSVLDFEEEHGRLVATKVVERDPVDAVYGALALPAPTDALLDELRGAGDR